MEIKRLYEYIVQVKIRTGIESTDWANYGWFDDGVAAFKKANEWAKAHPEREYRVVEQTTIQTVIS